MVIPVSSQTPRQPAGKGTPALPPETGALLSEARSDRVNAAHIALMPGIAIVLTVLAPNLLGDGLREALDQKPETVR